MTFEGLTDHIRLHSRLSPESRRLFHVLSRRPAISRLCSSLVAFHYFLTVCRHSNWISIQRPTIYFLHFSVLKIQTRSPPLATVPVQGPSPSSTKTKLTKSQPRLARPYTLKATRRAKLRFFGTGTSSSCRIRHDARLQWNLPALLQFRTHCNMIVAYHTRWPRPDALPQERFGDMDSLPSFKVTLE